LETVSMIEKTRRKRWHPKNGVPPTKVLIIQLRRIGDSVLVTPVLDSLREAWPAARLHLLTSEPVPELFIGDSRIDVVWVRPPRPRLARLTSDLRDERYDLAFDFQSLPLTAIMARATGGYTVGFKKRARSLLYHRSVDLEAHAGSHFAADHKLDLLRAVGLEPRVTQPRLAPLPASTELWQGMPEGPRVALMPVSPWAHKRWLAESFARTARLLHEETGAVFVLAGGPGEEGMLGEVAEGMEDVPHRVHAFERVRDLMAFLAGADLFVGNDNGPRHIALALNVPTVAWFGRHNPTNWTPPTPGPHSVLWDRSRARGRVIRDDLDIVPDQPAAAARSAARLLDLAAGSSR
jgi:ADP-heptose:LPS heptosyltransferase